MQQVSLLTKEYRTVDYASGPLIFVKNIRGRLRRRRLNPDCELRGTDLIKSVQTTSANRTNYATLPLAA